LICLSLLLGWRSLTLSFFVAAFDLAFFIACSCGLQSAAPAVHLRLRSQGPITPPLMFFALPSGDRSFTFKFLVTTFDCLFFIGTLHGLLFLFFPARGRTRPSALSENDLCGATLHVFARRQILEQDDVFVFRLLSLCFFHRFETFLQEQLSRHSSGNPQAAVLLRVAQPTGISGTKRMVSL
jgi:hypothetical protein